jgi:hypothetical protein
MLIRLSLIACVMVFGLTSRFIAFYIEKKNPPNARQLARLGTTEAPR